MCNYSRHVQLVILYMIAVTNDHYSIILDALTVTCVRTCLFRRKKDYTGKMRVTSGHTGDLTE